LLLVLVIQRELLAGHVVITCSARNEVQSEGQGIVIITISLSEVRRLSGLTLFFRYTDKFCFLEVENRSYTPCV
jgi:hypothetical protein